MELFEKLAGVIMEGLKKDTALEKIEFVEAFSSIQREVPPERLYAAVGIGTMKLVPAALDDYLGIKDGAEMYGRQAEVEVQLQICAPTGLGGKACVEAFSKIVDSLLFSENGLCLQTISCGKPSFSASMKAFALEGKIGVTAWLCNSYQKDGV